MMRFLLGALAAVFMIVPSAWAADGADCSTLPYTVDMLGGKGRLRPVWCVVLCDNDSGNADCSSYDMNSQKSGLMDVISFELVERDDPGASGAQDGTFDCSAGTVTINTAPISGLTTAHTNAFDLGSTTSVALGGTRKIIMDQKSAPLDRYVYSTTSSMSCTNDSIDLLMVGYKEEKF